MSNSHPIDLQQAGAHKYGDKLIVEIPGLDVMGRELRYTAMLCQAHRLYHSSKW